MSLGSAITHRSALLIDVLVLAVLCGVHTIVWWTYNTAAVDENESASSRMQQATTAGLTVAGILVPLTIIAISSEGTKASIPNGVLVDFLAANVWFFCSIVAGLLVLYLSFYRKNPLKSKPINIFAGYQLFFLLVGGFRLVWGFGGLVEAFLT